MDPAKKKCWENGLYKNMSSQISRGIPWDSNPVLHVSKKKTPGKKTHPTRWGPSSYKLYNPYKWPYKWLTVLITLVIGVINPVITGRGPTL